MMRLGSLFDGSGGFCLAGSMNGITPVWSSEIEPYPLRVTAARFPDVQQLGDVTKINGAEIEPVDVITFGSPCQDLSVAGKQAGLTGGARSSLFFEAIRIIKEMRDATADEFPRWAVWENVPGAFSSNKGEDFRAVLEAFCNVRGGANISVPLPAKRKWLPAGCVVGDGFSLAWRVYDAQYWGVPQRRKRIYLVADFGSERAGEILFEREGLPGDTATRGEAREGTAADAERGVGGSGGVGLTNRGYVSGDKAETLRAESHMALPCVVQPSAFMGGQGAKAGGIGYCDDGTTPTLKAAPSGGNTVPDVCYALQGNGIDRADTAGCNGCGWRTDQMYTLNTIDRPAIAATVGSFMSNGKDVSMKLMSRDYKDPQIVCYGANEAKDALSIGNGQMNNITMKPIANTLDTMDDVQKVMYESDDSQRKYIVRRLTPLECCRLQGFPDWWEDGVDGSDSARYKMWGNGIALPCANDVLRRIGKACDET